VKSWDACRSLEASWSKVSYSGKYREKLQVLALGRRSSEKVRHSRASVVCQCVGGIQHRQTSPQQKACPLNAPRCITTATKDTVIYIHTYIHACIHTYTCIHIYMHTCIHTCMHTYMYTHTYTHTYIHTYVYVYTYITYTHIYIYTHRTQPKLLQNLQCGKATRRNAHADNNTPHLAFPHRPWTGERLPRTGEELGRSPRGLATFQRTHVDAGSKQREG
jgi:hypothetical protein